MKKLLPKIIICILICAGLGSASGFSTVSAITGWYQTIQKPSWNPPNQLFGPVWTVLYIMMGISAALIWHDRHNAKKTAISLFVIQLMLNLLWSYIFFGKQDIFLAFIEIIAMWIFILLTIIYFYQINKIAAYLLIPYLLWVSFATFLNYSIYLLNN